MRYVLDCSVAVKWFVPEEDSPLALRVLDGVRQGTVELAAPDSIVAEFGHAVRRLVLGGRMDAEQGHRALSRFLELPVEVVSSRALASAALKLAIARSATFYDALYIELATRQDLKVLTADERMTNAFAPLDRALLLRDFVA